MSTDPAFPAAGAPKRFTRTPDDAWIAGVCGGIARYFGIDSAIIRVAFVASILLPGPQFLIYALLWLVMPKAQRTY